MPRRNSQQLADHRRSALWRWGFVLVLGVILLMSLLRSRHQNAASQAQITTNFFPASDSSRVESTHRQSRTGRPERSASLSAEEIVARKLAQFSRSRLELAQKLARKHKVEVPSEVERFFALVEAGAWDEIDAAFQALKGGAGSDKKRGPGVDAAWPAILDAYGAADQVHLWPAQQLLDYGNSILQALRPGMVYVGGTDNGRWIPELLNDTSDGERHIIVTQNALADSTYAEYITELYGDRFATLSKEDSDWAFQEYLQDAQKRLQHDQQFPDEPKQVRPNEQIEVNEGKVQVGGVVAVMSINEKLLQALMNKNPELWFGIQESFPMQGTYAEAKPRGPLMELRGINGGNEFTQDYAADSLDYWRAMAQKVLSEPEAINSDATLKSYSHDTAAAANLMAAHNYPAEAEQAYRLATRLWPGNPESTAHLADLLQQQGRQDEAKQLLDNFARQYPDQRSDLDRVSAIVNFTRTGGK